MKVFEMFTLKRVRTTVPTSKNKVSVFDNLPPDVLVAEDGSSSISSSSSEGEHESSYCPSPSQCVESKSSIVTRNIQDKLNEAMLFRKQQRSARHERLEAALPSRQCETTIRMNTSPDAASSRSVSLFLSPRLELKRKIRAVQEQQVKNLLAMEILLLQRVDVFEQ